MTPKLFVVSAPSGTGKTTIVRRLVGETAGVGLAVSHTTRDARENEEHGRDYIFVSDSAFDEIRRTGGFLEHANVFGNRYGTSRKEVEGKLAEGTQVILEIDWQGAEQVRRAMPEARSIFLLPPSRAELRKRLEGRNSDKPEVLSRRFSEARQDIHKWCDFHYVLINEDLDETCRRLSLILKGGGGEHAVSDKRRRGCIQELIARGGWDEGEPRQARSLAGKGQIDAESHLRTSLTSKRRG